MAEKIKKANIKQLIEGYWALSRTRQEAFLKALHELSPQNKDFFSIWLGNDTDLVVESLLKEIVKETTGRVGKFRKLRLSKLNEILRNADKYSLSMLDRIRLRDAVWRGMLQFILAKKYLPDRYEIACSRHLEVYIVSVNYHVLETSEKEELLEKTKQYLEALFTKRHFLPHIEDVYLKHFPS